MTCAGISSLILAGSRRYEGLEHLEGETIRDCGKGGFNASLAKGIDWLATHFDVKQNFGNGQQWKFYYLYALERAGRLGGVRFFGQNDWYRLGAEEIVRAAEHVLRILARPARKTTWSQPVLPCCSSPRGAPGLDQQAASIVPSMDWNNDPDDVRNIVSIVSADWKNLLTWQVVDPRNASIQEMLQAPIVFFNGHDAPEFSPAGQGKSQGFVEQGGFIFADACCSSRAVRPGLQALDERAFRGGRRRAQASAQPIIRSGEPSTCFLRMCSRFWGSSTAAAPSSSILRSTSRATGTSRERSPANPAVIRSIKVGQNVIDYATGREMPADKLVVHDVIDFKADAPKRGALRIAKLKHGGDWNIAPQAIPNLMEVLRKPPLSFDVVINHKELVPRDPNLDLLPARSTFTAARSCRSTTHDLEALRKHLDPGGGTLFADAACGSPMFDGSFRKFVAMLLPNNPLVPIPRNDELYGTKIGFDLSDVRYTDAAGGAHDFPQLEGVKINDHWAIIYSKFDIGCALERHTGLECKGYTHESAAQDRGQHRDLLDTSVTPRTRPVQPSCSSRREIAPNSVATGRSCAGQIVKKPR